MTAIDVLVHPIGRNNDELREFLHEPWKSRSMPGIERYWYPNPVGEFHPSAAMPKRLPGSDPATTERHVLDEAGADLAILVPLTRGLLPDAEQGTAICAATNDWLAKTWLDRSTRFRGSIRVNPQDPAGAAREIARWSGDRRMVQVAMPLQAHHPYGQRMYLPIWEAAARAGLPLLICSDVAAGIEFWPTSVGYPRHFIEHAMMNPFNAYHHLASFICEGVFDRLPTFKVVFGDPAFGILHSILWRLDKGWRSLQSDTPWAKRTPSEYIDEHVRFCSGRDDGPPERRHLAGWLRASRGERLLLFGSRYPYWDLQPAKGAFADLEDDDLRQRVMATNARELYGL